jgi:hypothetical protein
VGSGGVKKHESYAIVPAHVVTIPLPKPVAHGASAVDGHPSEPEPAIVDIADDEVAEPDADAVSAIDDIQQVEVTAGPPPTHDVADALTPVPTAPPVGLVTGVPLLVGGADLHDSLATLVSYTSATGPREVLLATVNEEAEAKLLEALALSTEKLIPVQVQEEITGRLPADTDKQLYEQLVTVAKSVNHHLKAGDGIPAHTEQTLASVQAQLATLVADGAPTADEQAMAAHYLAHAQQIADRLQPTFATPYADGGKVPPVTAHQVTGMQTVTKYVPAPAETPGGDLLPAAVRAASRIAPTISADGAASWDGSSRTKANGKEYAIDLGDGYSAVYRPYASNDPSTTEYTLRGALDVVAPPGAGHGPELVHRLAQLHLVNRPMTAAEGEYTYLRSNIQAQQLAGKPAVKDAMAQAEGLEDAVEQVLLGERAHQAIGLDDAGLHRFAKHLRLEAEARALPVKVRLLREAVAHATGHADGTALAASPGYDPTPRPSGGWLTWGRFDVDRDPAAVKKAFGSRGLTHSLTHGNIVEVLRTGVLACTERRHVMGIPSGKGCSEAADKKSGGAHSVFLRVGAVGGAQLSWTDPTVLLRRADWYAYNSDHYGATNPASSHSTHGQIRDPLKLAGVTSGSNEVMFRNGLDLLGAEAPTRIKCTTPAQRSEVLELLAARGITTLGGRPVAEVVA